MHIRLVSSAAPAGRSPHRQASEKPGLKSLPSRSAPPSLQPRIADDSAAPIPGHAAGLASEKAAIAERTQWMQWLGSNLHRNSTDLLPRLPFDDAVKLASLVGTGQTTWPEINAALDARIKLAMSDALNRQREQLDLRPPSSQQSEAWHAHYDWDEAKRNGEAEVWARYHAKCDAVFAHDTAPLDTGSRALEQLLSRERTLDRLRSARDRELADLTRDLGPQPPRPTFPVSSHPYQIAMLRSQLTPAENDALRKLDATGFTSSADMIEAIDTLAAEIADDASRVA